jgi:hypothetical protein
MVPALCFAAISLAFMLRSEKISQLWFWASVLFMILAFYTHPGVVPFLMFVPVLAYSQQAKNYSFWSFAFLFGFMLIKRFVSENSTYESGIFENLQISNFVQFYKLWSWQYLTGSFTTRYLLATAIFVIGLLLSWKESSVKPALYQLLTLVFGIWLVVTIFGTGDSIMMMEKNFAPIVLLMLTPLASLQKSDLMHSRFVMICSFAVVIAGGVQRYESSQFFSHRLEQLDVKLNKCSATGIEKAGLPKDSLAEKDWKVVWALPYESLLRSEIKLKKSITLRTTDSLLITKGANEPGLFLGADFAYPIHTDTMNHEYFHLSKEGIYTPYYGAENHKKEPLHLKK